MLTDKQSMVNTSPPPTNHCVQNKKVSASPIFTPDKCRQIPPIQRECGQERTSRLRVPLLPAKTSFSYKRRRTTSSQPQQTIN